MSAARALRLAFENRWIGAGGAGDRSRPEWRVHGLGQVHLELYGDRLAVRLDGRRLDRERAERLLQALAGYDGRVRGIDFAVWAGPPGGGRWIDASFADCGEAAGFVRRLAAVTVGPEWATALDVLVLGRSAVPPAARVCFDPLVAAWRADRAAGAAAFAGWFAPGRAVPHQGLKIVRRFAGNLRFEAYRMATAHRWLSGQETVLPGGDLRAVLDRRLAASLLQAVARAGATGAPLYEQLSGLVQVETGHRFTSYHRLTLPLDDPGGDALALVATCW